MKRRQNTLRAACLLATIIVLTTDVIAADAQTGHFCKMARSAIGDLVQHYWVGDESTGHIVNTWHGYTNSLPDLRGALWERAMLYVTLDNAQQVFGDPLLAKRLRADWNRTKSLYKRQQLEACGEKSHTNWAADDAGWSALMYLAAYRVTADPDALGCAAGIVKNSLNHWQDDEFGGGMWYSDAHKSKSLYQTSIILAALRVDELRGDHDLTQRALDCYDWIEQHLLRGDGLYWCDFLKTGPGGTTRPNDIHEAGSVVFLGGNMAMAVIHARLYRQTGKSIYRERALRTANGILKKLVSANGIFINDRDAWTNAVFAGDWAREILNIEGIRAEHARVLRATADSIFKNARTADGFYGGSWSGPAEGGNSIWFSKKSKPQQIMTSANSANMIVAAAILDSTPTGAH